MRYILTADSNLDTKLVEAFHREQIGVWYMTFGDPKDTQFEPLLAHFEQLRQMYEMPGEGKENVD